MIKPWIGDKWGNSNNSFCGVRLLVLGESAHDADSAIGSSPENLLIQNVNIYTQTHPRPNWRFYIIITTLLAGRESASQLAKDDVENIWQSLVFTNYVQVVAANWSRCRPTHEMFVESTGPFAELCNSLKPEAVLVCGLDNSGWVARGLGLSHPWEQSRYSVPFDGGSAVAARIQHPSSGFSYSDWRPTLTGLLDSARSRRENRE